MLRFTVLQIPRAILVSLFLLACHAPRSSGPQHLLGSHETENMGMEQSPPPSPFAYEHFLRAEIYFNHGNWEEAGAEYELARAGEYRVPLILARLGECTHKLASTDEQRIKALQWLLERQQELMAQGICPLPIVQTLGRLQHESGQAQAAFNASMLLFECPGDLPTEALVWLTASYETIKAEPAMDSERTKLFRNKLIAALEQHTLSLNQDAFRLSSADALHRTKLSLAWIEEDVSAIMEWTREVSLGLWGSPSAGMLHDIRRNVTYLRVKGLHRHIVYALEPLADKSMVLGSWAHALSMLGLRERLSSIPAEAHLAIHDPRELGLYIGAYLNVSLFNEAQRIIDSHPVTTHDGRLNKDMNQVLLWLLSGNVQGATLLCTEILKEHPRLFMSEEGQRLLSLFRERLGNAEAFFEVPFLEFQPQGLRD